MYNKPIPSYGDLITLESFIESCHDGSFIDYDGFGNPVKDGLVNEKIKIYPSRLHLIPNDATHIIWFNK